MPGVMRRAVFRSSGLFPESWSTAAGAVWPCTVVGTSGKLSPSHTKPKIIRCSRIVFLSLIGMVGCDSSRDYAQIS